MNILIDELTLDPLAIGYTGMTDQQVVDSLNALTRPIQFLSGSAIFNATDDTEYDTLTDAQKSSWDALCSIDVIDTSNGIAKARERELFGPGTTTRSNLQSLRVNKQSRAQELGISRVREGHVQEARA